MFTIHLNFRHPFSDKPIWMVCKRQFQNFKMSQILWAKIGVVHSTSSHLQFAFMNSSINWIQNAHGRCPKKRHAKFDNSSPESIGHSNVAFPKLFTEWGQNSAEAVVPNPQEHPTGPCLYSASRCSTSDIKWSCNCSTLQHSDIALGYPLFSWKLDT